MEIKELELTGDELLSAIKESGLDKSFQAYLQKYTDQKVSSGISTYKKNQGDKNLTDQERITGLEKEISDLKSGIAKGDLDTLIKAELKKEGLNEELIKYVRIESPDKVGEAVKDLKEDFLDLKQKEINIRLKEGEIPNKGETIAVDSVIEKFVEGKNTGKTEGPFEGKSSENKEGD